MRFCIHLGPTWADSVADLPQDFSAPDLAPGCSAGLVELECFHKEANYCVLLSRACPWRFAFLWYHQVCAAANPPQRDPLSQCRCCHWAQSQTHPSHAPANELLNSAWTTSDTLGSLDTTILSSLPGINRPGLNV